MIAKKKYGQNFLVDKNKLNEIIDSLNLNKDDTVIEVGPGKGAITFPIADRVKKIKAIEIDLDMIPLLEDKRNNLEVINSDVLKINFSDISEPETKFISNLPYYISSKIIFKAIAEKNITSISVMLQKEMADRITSQHGNKVYGRLTVAINSFFKVESKIKVPRKCFAPAPDVESVFLNLYRWNDVEDSESYLNFIKLSFAQKRKKWINSLKNKNFKYIEHCIEWIHENNKSMSIRAEEISVEEFLDIWKNIINKR